ncbi:two-component system, response regulator YesN [Thermoactinomyces sp. DSM 45891]|uniref:response regulator n=1 Tax=Thermoactinomyces sp. DSM 45891 TaxID=1761907 RepID=UPI00091D04C5|nr:response regulator [Thermoactinomyces sp. DSM 45891]SFX65421.1 two-component system, response regulator YesN [Thermoactinomyces sp. DSM 45891]
MIRILIVDDEEIERVALEKILTTHLDQVEVVATVGNGREAIEKTGELKPDLLLMDIQMPGFNGLEAIERIREKFSTIKVVIVSSYDTFTFAQQAIRLGVKDYLLKPSKVQAIVETIRKLCDEIVQERSHRIASKEETDHRIQKVLPILESEYVSRLLFDQVPAIDLEEMSNFMGIAVQPPASVIVVSIQWREDWGQQDRSLKDFMCEMQAELRGRDDMMVGSVSGHILPLLCFHRKGEERRLIGKMMEQIRRLDCRDTKLHIGLGVGRAKAVLDDLRFSYQEALIACSDLGMGQGYRIRFYDDLSQEQGKDHKRLRVERKLIEAIRNERWQDTKEIIFGFLSVSEQRQTTLEEAKQRLYGHFLLLIHLLDEMGVKEVPATILLRGQSYMELWQEARVKIEELDVAYQRFQQNAQFDAFDQVKKYIEEHFMEDLSLEQLAKFVQLSPFYLSKCFKEVFGISYVDYMTQCRISRAKEYIRQGGLSFKEIAYEVGYHDPNYFSRVFKKTCGLSPSQYRDKMKTI